MAILTNQFVLLPLFGICVFLFSYANYERFASWIYSKTFESRNSVLELFDKMFVEVDQKNITWMMVLLSFGLGFLVFLVFWPNVVAGFIFGGIATMIGWSVPRRLVSYLWEKRCNQISNQMVDGMTIMGNGIKAGLSITQSMERVIANMSGPLPQEFNLILNKVRLGMTLEEALNDFGGRVPRQDVQMLVNSVNILKETGGNLAETFAAISETVRERQKIEKKIEAMTAQGIMQGIIITLVPFFLLGVFAVIDPGYIKPLFTKPLGWVSLAIVLGLQIIGGTMIKKIVTIKV